MAQLDRFLRDRLPDLVAQYGCRPLDEPKDFGKLARRILEKTTELREDPLQPGTCRTFKRKKPLPAPAEGSAPGDARLDTPFSFAAHGRAQFAIWLGIELGRGTYKATKLVALLSRPEGWHLELKAKSTFQPWTQRDEFGRACIDRARGAAEALKDQPHIAQTEHTYARVGKDGTQKFGSIARLYAPRDLRQVLAKLRTEGEKLTRGDVLGWSHDILLGLEATHAKALVNLDVSSKNILFEQARAGAPFRAVVSDLDFCMTFADAQKPKPFPLGTPLYSLPRKDPSGRGYVQGPADDVFAAGVIMHELSMGDRPTEAPPGAWIAEPVLEYRRAMLDRGDPFQRLLFEMLDPDPSRRPSARDARKSIEAIHLAEGLDRFGAGSDPGARMTTLSPSRAAPQAAGVRRPLPEAPVAEPPKPRVAMEPEPPAPALRPAPLPILHLEPPPRPPPSAPISIPKGRRPAQRTTLAPESPDIAPERRRLANPQHLQTAHS